ncbi:MAG: hypothetical protein K8R21_10610 [Leptospira sp.]|nr:hypothetical protein [Leptospira sp.]
MAFIATKTRTWNKSTPADGDLIDDEMDRIYENMNTLKDTLDATPEGFTGLIQGELLFNSTSLPPKVSAGSRGINLKLVKNGSDIAPALTDVFNKSRPILDTYCAFITVEDENGNVKHVLNAEGPVSGHNGNISSISGSGTTKTINYSSGSGADDTGKIIAVWDGSILLFVSKITGGNGSSTHICETLTGSITGSVLQYQVYERMKSLHGSGSAVAITTDSEIIRYTPSLGENGWPTSIFAWDNDKQGWYCTLPGLEGWRAIGTWQTDGSGNVIKKSLRSYKSGRNKNDNFIDLYAFAGKASANAICYYSSINYLQGCDFILVMDATNGLSITPKCYGRMSGAASGNTSGLGWSLNSSQLSTQLDSITATDIKAVAANGSVPVNIDTKIIPDDVYRLHGNTGNSASVGSCVLVIEKEN